MQLNVSPPDLRSRAHIFLDLPESIWFFSKFNNQELPARELVNSP